MWLRRSSIAGATRSRSGRTCPKLRMSRGCSQRSTPPSEGWTFSSTTPGSSASVPPVDITEESFYAHYNVNVLGAILTVQEALQRFGPEGGSVITLSSIVGSHPVAGAVLYASTKGAIETLTKGLAFELAPLKIRVNAIAPGHTETEGNVTARTFDGGLAPPWPRRHRSAGSDASPISRRWRYSSRRTNQPGSPERSSAPRAVSW